MKTSFLLLFYFIFSQYLFSQERNLVFYLSQSKTNSALLADYQNQITSQDIDHLLLKSKYGFQVAANTDLLYAPIIKGYGYDEVLSNGQQIIALISVRKEIIGKYWVDAFHRTIALNQDSLRNQVKITEATIEKSIIEQYILAYTDQEQLRLSKEIIDLLLNEDEILKKLTQSSVFKQTDYLAFKVNVQQQLLANQQLEIQYKNNLASLNYLAGIVDTANQQIEKPEIAFQNPISFNNSYYFEGYRIDSLKNKNNNDLINLNYKPQLSVFTDAGYQSSLTVRPYKNMGWSVGLKLSIPIYDGNKRKMLVAQNNLREKSRQAYEEYSRHQYQQLTIQLKQLIQQYDKLINDSEKQMEFSKTLVMANSLQLRSGDVRMTDYLLSINNHLNLRSSAVLNQSNRLLLINQLNHLLLKSK